MTGIYGMGNAYNIRFAQRSVVRPQIRPSYPAPPPRHGCGCGTSGSVTIGPRGFFGFMSGFLPSFMMGFGLMGMVTGIVNMFRKPKTPVMYSPSMNMPFYNNINANNSTQFANLKDLASKKGYTAYNNANGTYTVVDSKGNLIAENLSYDNMMKRLAEAQGSAKSKETSETESKEKVAQEAQGSKKAGTTNPNGKATTNEETETNVSESPAASSTSSNQAKAGTSNQAASSVTADNKATEAKANITDTEADDVDANAVSEQASAKQAKNKPAASKYRKGQDLRGWYKLDNSRTEGNPIMAMVKSKTGRATAQDVVNTILKGKMDYLSEADRADLVKQMIANNPSVFDENGNAYPNGGSNWSKLDIPSSEALKDKYVKANTTTTFNRKNGKVTYTNKSGVKYTVESPMTDKNKHIIRGQNGYSVEYKKGGGLIFRNNNGNIIDEKEFAKTCKNMYKSAKAWQKNQLQAGAERVRNKYQQVIDNGTD